MFDNRLIRFTPLMLSSCFCLLFPSLVIREYCGGDGGRAGRRSHQHGQNKSICLVSQVPQETQEFLAWQQDLESDSKCPTQARPTVFRWLGGAKEVFVSGSFNNWTTKIPLNKRYVDSCLRRAFLCEIKCDMLRLSQ